MPPKRGRGRRGAAEPEDRVDHIERILERLIQVVHDVHNNNNHEDAPQPPAMPMPGTGAMPCTTIKKFQQLKPLTFYGTPDPMAAESCLLRIERVFEVLSCTDEQKVAYVTFTFEGAALIWWQLKKPLEPLWLWPRREGLKLDYDGISRTRCGQEGHQIRDCPMKNKIQGARTSMSASVQQPQSGRRNNQP
ncbi:hypothetical protein Acr_20g0002960 [Actinidia rufa]|uniref:CCHC-type domain-containing protein n=1 Tax=Actinidia rufa TaxID=165716 RepID=A0A7J0GCR4_9ERIC|nr:hypothetical protein Acr_20g0002960 [Actinidia rufa]